MFNLFSKKVKDVSVTSLPEHLTIKTKYGSAIDQIHHEFNIESDILLNEAQSILNKQTDLNIDKAKLLKSIGFTNVPEVKELTSIETRKDLAKNVADLILEYRYKYPFNRFITEDSVARICRKYNLVCGTLDLFKGFVPQKNLEEISNFVNNYKVNAVYKFTSSDSRGNAFIENPFIELSNNAKNISTDSYHVIEDKNNNLRFQQEIHRHNGIDFYGDYNGNFGTFQKQTMKICAPLKDMDTKGMNLNGYKLEKHIPDPIILQPIKGGYLIVTAWGDEASDFDVTNSANN